MDSENANSIGITRRQLFGAAAVGGAGLVLATTLSGCGSNDLNLDTDYLPLGSVVKIKSDENTNIYRMIVARRPQVSKILDDPEKGTYKSASDLPIFDYAGCIWPLGFCGDLSNRAYVGELSVFYSNDITEVKFVGYRDDLEKQANKILSDAMNTTETVDTLLLDLGNSLLNK